MQGKLYGVGVGPGDPELLTLKALRLIKENEVIAVPGKDIQASVAYQIVKGAYEELDEKTLIPVAMPMTKDPQVLKANHDKKKGKMWFSSLWEIPLCIPPISMSIKGSWREDMRLRSSAALPLSAPWQPG